MNHKILVIDPDIDYATLIEQTFPDEQVIVAETETEAIALLPVELPDVIILAIELPGSSGFSLCRKIKKHTRWREIPLILVSSGASNETFEMHSRLQDHANEYMLKPFDSEQIREIVRPYLSLPREEKLKELQALSEDVVGGPPVLIFAILGLGIVGFIVFNYLL